MLERKKNQEQLLHEAIIEIARDASSERVKDLSTYLQLGETDLSLISDFLLTNAQLNGLETRLATIDQLENELKIQISNYPKLIAEYNRLQPKIETQRQTLERLLQQRETLILELAKGVIYGRSLKSQTWAKDISTALSERLVLGIIVGLFLGVGLAFALNAIDTTVRTSDDLKKSLPFPVLGNLPLVTRKKSQGSNIFQSIIDLNSGSQESIEVQQWDILEPILHPTFREPIDIIGNLLLQNKKQVLASPRYTGRRKEHYHFRVGL